MGFINAIVGGATGLMTGGLPGAAVGALSGLASDRANSRTQGQLAQSTEISEKAYQNLDPYRQAGTAALSKYMELLGLETPGVGTGAGTGAGNGVTGGAPYTGGSMGYGGQFTSQAREGWSPADEYQLQNMLEASKGGDGAPQVDPNVLAELQRRKAAAQGMGEGNAPGVPTMGAPGSANPQPQRSIYDMLRDTPGYKFQTQEEERAINRAAAGRGQFLSGNVLEELASRAGERGISTAYNQQLSALSGLAGAGQNAAVGQGSIAGGIADTRYNTAVSAGRDRDMTASSNIKLLDQALAAYNKGNSGTAPPPLYPSVIPMPTMTA